ncbi:L,D-transpeptidase [Egbenema bharatensis]|uniref:L,D-transpeptidase n=1 Tax=Egbenema bharatensis TaxID=3463334 RepID=UPI003A892E45
MRNRAIQRFGLAFLLGLTASACSEVVNPQYPSYRADAAPAETSTPLSEHPSASPLPQTTPSTPRSDRFSSPGPSLQTQESPTLDHPLTSRLDRPTVASSHSSPSSTTASELNAQETSLEISLGRREVTLYRGNTAVKSYPIGIGRAGWETPLGTFEVQQMREDPVWIHPFTDERIPSGDARNPLGTRWIGFWTDGRLWVGFHGTSDPSSVGTAASHGCIRMHNADVEELYTQIELGTPVRVVQ